MSTLAIEVVHYDRRWEVAQTAFASRNWPGKIRRGDPGYLRWEYRGAPEGPVDGLLLAVEGETVVGQMGAIPALIHDGVDERPAQWIGNLMVDPDHRRKGVLTAVFETALARPVLTLGSDPSPSASATMASVGFERADASALMVLPLAMGPVVSTRYPQAARFDRVITAIGAPATRVLTRQLRAAQADGGAQVCSWQDVVADVVAAEAALAGPHLVHDEEFLRWRCRGFAPWVREVDAVRTDHGSFAIVERGGNRLLVLHWHATSSADAAAIMGRVAYLAGAYGLSYVQAMAIDPQQVGELAALGFRARHTPSDFWWYPAGSLGSATVAVQGYDTDQNL